MVIEALADLLPGLFIIFIVYFTHRRISLLRERVTRLEMENYRTKLTNNNTIVNNENEI